MFARGISNLTHSVTFGDWNWVEHNLWAVFPWHFPSNNVAQDSHTIPKSSRCSPPGPGHWGPWDAGYDHAREWTFKQHIWKVSGFWEKSPGTFFSLWLCMLWVISAGSFFLPQKTNNKTKHSNFSSQFQAAAWVLPETRAVPVTDTSSFVLTLLSSASLKGKQMEKHIQRHKSPQSLRSSMGEEPCWEIPRGTWCCLLSPGLIYPWRETSREDFCSFLALLLSL